MKFYLFVEFLFLSFFMQNTFAQDTKGSEAPKLYTIERALGGNTETIKLKSIIENKKFQLVDLYTSNAYKTVVKYLSVNNKFHENTHQFDGRQFQELVRNFGFASVDLNYDKNTSYDDFSSALNSQDKIENEDVFILVSENRYYYVNAVYFIR